MYQRLRQVRIPIVVAFLLMFGFFGLFFFYPIFSTLGQAIYVNGDFTVNYVTDILEDRNYLEGLTNAFVVGIFSTMGAVLIALPLAVVADRFDFPFKPLLVSLLLIPLILPPFVGAIGVKQILGQTGALNVFLSWFGLVDMSNPVDWLGRFRFVGMIVMNSLHLYPIVFLNVAASLASLDPALEEAAENLGSSRVMRFFQITLPLTLPGLFAGCTISFIWAFTELGVPLIFDFSRITSVQIFDGIKDLNENNPFPYALVVVVMIISTLVFLIGKVAVGRTTVTGSGHGSTGRFVIPLKKWRGRICSAAFMLVVFLGTVPHLGVLLVSVSGDWYESVLPNSFTLEHFESALGHAITVPSIGNSLHYAGMATLLNLVIGVAIAYMVVRTRLWGRQLLDAMAMMPLAVPGLVLAFGYLAMTREGQPFRWLVENPFVAAESPVLLLIVAYSVRRLPYIVRSAVAGFQQTSSSLEEAAANLGASPVHTIMTVTVPLIAASLFAGGLLAFSFSMLEVSDSLIQAQKQAHFPITTAIYTLSGTLGDGFYLAAALGVWAMIFLACSIIAGRVLLGKRLSSLFHF